MIRLTDLTGESAGDKELPLRQPMQPERSTLPTVPVGLVSRGYSGKRARSQGCARDRVRKKTLKLDRTSEVPEVLDSHGVFATVVQRYVRGSDLLPGLSPASTQLLAVD